MVCPFCHHNFTFDQLLFDFFVRFDLDRSNVFVVSEMILHYATRSMYWITPFYQQSIYDAAAVACVRKDANIFFNEVARLKPKP